MKKKTIAIAVILSGILTSGMSALAADGIEINHLGVNNTMVRVEGDNKLLILPVQESIDDAKVDVVVDGKLERTFFVRLAKSKVDYTVPFDLSPYAGHDVVLNVITSQNRSSVREAKDDVCWNAMELADTFNTENREKFRPVYHHTPLYGWMNDPNGMFYKDGVWHLYYQYNPYGSKWQNMTWGHSSSTDLINWKHHPLAIEPNGLGAVFSGSCALDPQNTAGFGEDAVIALYTSAAASQVQSLAHSNDNGETFEIYPGNPVITQESEARDPNMFYNPATKEWNLVLAHALDHEILFYTSPNLKDWTLQSAFGKVAAQGGVWECPDLFELPVGDTGEKKWMLVVNLNPGGPFGGSGVQYFIGDWDGKKFTPDKDASGNVATKWLDYGKDNYALVSWSDAPQGRRSAIGWMSNWQYAADVPTTQFRSANTLPRDITLFKADDGQIYAASNPSPELMQLRGKLIKKADNVKLSKEKTYKLPAENNGVCEIVAEIENAKDAEVAFTFANALGQEVVMKYNGTDETFSMDRTRSGLTDFSHEFPAVTTAPTFGKDGKLALRIFIDRSSMEIFGNDGRFSMTNLVFPEQPYATLTVKSSNPNARLADIQIYSIKQ